MAKKHQYSCIIYLGNISIAETEMQKQALTNLLKSFYCKEFEFNKEEHSDGYYYKAHIDFTEHSYIKVLRFTEALVAFTLFWNMNLHEIRLD